MFGLNCSSSLQVLLYLSRVLVIVAGGLSVEPHVPVIDIVHIMLLSVAPSTTVL